MSSNINAAIPPLGAATTSGVRANFSAAKTEIEALQTRTGFVDYNDLTTSTTPIAVAASTWTKLTNDKAGANTKIDALPSGVTSVWNTTTNQLDLSQLPINTTVEIRADIVVTTTSANQIVKTDIRLGIGSGIEFTLENSETQFKTAGAHKMVVMSGFYIGSSTVRTTPGELRIWSDATASVKVNGWYIRIVKAL